MSGRNPLQLKTVKVLIYVAGCVGALAAGIYLLTLPGMLRLPEAKQVALDGVTTIEDATRVSRASGLQGWELAAYAQNLAARKFTYSRRNPWDTPSQAFARGMGYCQQQALALKEIYDGLGIESRPFYATRARFPAKTVHGIDEPESISGHAWLRVTIAGETREVCPGHVDNTPGQVHFEVLSEVKPLDPWLQPVTHLFSVIENARRDLAAR